MAGVFVHGDDTQILHTISRYHFGYSMGGSPLLNAFELIEADVQEQSRWESIAAMGLMASVFTTPRVSLQGLLDSPPQKSWREWQKLHARILAHVPREGIERRLMLIVQKRFDRYSNSSVTALMVSDFASQPEARQQLEAGLRRDDPQWIAAVDWMNGNDNPLRDVALEWARRHLSGQMPRESWIVCTVVRRFGNAADLNALAARIERARRAHSAEYKELLRASSSGDYLGRGYKFRLLPARVWSRLLDDKTLYQQGMRGWRWCDVAATQIAFGARLNFKIQEGSTLEQRDRAVARARAVVARTVKAQ